MNALLSDDSDYKKWLEQLTASYRRSQIKAAVSVNREMLSFYWLLGRDISDMSSASRWGSGFYDMLSRDLRRTLPDARSFSVTNLRYMVRFYELFPADVEALPQTGDAAVISGTPAIRPQLGEELFCAPWGHIKLIIDKFGHDQERAVFYIRETVKNNWSRAVLQNWIETDLFDRQGKAISNFTLTLPAPQSDLAQEITKDPYKFDFIELSAEYNEKQLKDALTDNVQRFLMELGTGFAFIGREHRLVVGQTEQFLDLLFYHTRLHCYVVVEVKVSDFDPRDMGQLSTYVSAADGILKGEGDAPTLGLLICKTKDNVLAQYAVDALRSPVGISEYELTKRFPETVPGLLPSIEEIEKGLK
ncbi:MAG: PDDEXK nuclease domain-containing protein [Clostridia bacterium]|nr:PDDEXK nuclease domain-containing protein [Clostridia bacterium]